MLGVDDFAFRKGQVYGTILVDLERRVPIDLLPDRSAGTLAAWLKAHPGVETLSRDRSTTYKSGMSAGAPKATQVADRFHLLKNLEEALEKTFKGKISALKEVEQSLYPSTSETTTQSPKTPTQQQRQEQKDRKRSQRLLNYEQAHALNKQGHQVKNIARHLGMSERTVYTYLSYATFPEWQPTVRRTPSRSQLDDYKPYLRAQWEQGQQVTKVLFESIQQQGYAGSYMSVTRYTRKLRQQQRELLSGLSDIGPAPVIGARENKPLSAQRAAWLVMRQPQTLSAEEEKTLENPCQHSALSEAVAMTRSFLHLVRQRLPHQLDSWLERALSSSLKAFHSFANGIIEDYDAVKAGVTLEVSNGQVEGQNNRLKMLKRQMFGRAGLDLLTKRFILSRAIS